MSANLGATTQRRLPRRTYMPVRTAAGGQGLLAMPWWCSPAGIALGFLIPTICLIALAGEMQMSTLTIRGVRFLNLHAILLGALMLSPIALGGWIGSNLQLGAKRSEPSDLVSWERTAAVMVSIALLGYFFLFKELLFSPGILFQILIGAYKTTRQEMGATAGPSSLVNVSQVFFAIYAYRVVDPGPRPPPRWMHGVLALLAVLTLLRVYIYSERLAMMEMMVPLGIAFGRWMCTRRQPLWRGIATLGPYAALPIVILYFGAAEYFRSWGSAAYQGKSSFWEFAIGRFLSYYVTSLNNGAGVVATTPEATWKFEHVLEWAHRAPFGLGALFSDYVGFNAEAKSSFLWFLRTFADVEFNSNSGIYVPVADLGLHGALIYMLVIGLLAGLAFRGYRAGRLGGVLFFPLFFITFLEIFRYPFLGQPRSFTWILGIALALVVERALSARQRAALKLKTHRSGSRTTRKALAKTTAAGAASTSHSLSPAQDA